jgi:hypothetical protein
MVPGEYAIEKLSCYGLEEMKEIYTYTQGCKAYRAEAKDCVERSKALLKPTPWYASKFFWLTVGVGVGLGVSLAIQVK